MPAAGKATTPEAPAPPSRADASPATANPSLFEWGNCWAYLARAVRAEAELFNEQNAPNAPKARVERANNFELILQHTHHGGRSMRDTSVTLTLDQSACLVYFTSTAGAYGEASLRYRPAVGELFMVNEDGSEIPSEDFAKVMFRAFTEAIQAKKDQEEDDAARQAAAVHTSPFAVPIG